MQAWLAVPKVFFSQSFVPQFTLSSARSLDVLPVALLPRTKLSCAPTLITMPEAPGLGFEPNHDAIREIAKLPLSQGRGKG